MATSGEFPKVDGDIWNAYDANYLNNPIKIFCAGLYATDYNDFPVGGTYQGIYVKDNNNLVVSQPVTYKTTDGCSTWSTDSSFNGCELLISCLADKNYVLGFHKGNDYIRYSTDGSTTVGSTTVVNMGSTYGLGTACYPAINRAYCSAAATSGNGQWYSTDSGVNWIQASTGTSGSSGLFTAIGAASGSTTTAYGVQYNTKYVWKTTNGGVNWATTGWSMPETGTEPIRATNGTGYLHVIGTDAFIYCPNSNVSTAQIYYFTAGVSKPVYRAYNENAYGSPYGSNFCVLGNYIYFAAPGELLCSTDGGLTWDSKKRIAKTYDSSLTVTGTSLDGFSGNPNIIYILDHAAKIQRILDK